MEERVGEPVYPDAHEVASSYWRAEVAEVLVLSLAW